MTQLHDVLASDRRRNVLAYLERRPESRISRDEIVDALLEREPDEPGPATRRERLEVDLHHVHLPKLADAGIIDHDPSSGTVEYSASADLESLLSRCLAYEEADT